MSEPWDPLAWLRTGHVNLVVSLLLAVLLIVRLVPAIGDGATLPSVVYGVMIVLCLLNTVTGVRQYRRWRAARRQEH